jgi:DNA-binding transcriptional ArsR family regulator
MEGDSTPNQDEGAKGSRAKKARRLLPLVQRLATALKHPLRVRILSALIAGDSSATRLSREFGDVSVADAYYHLKILADECRLIDRVESRPVRGAVERFFSLRPGVTLAIRPVVVDERGVAEIGAVLQETMSRIKGVEKGCRSRLELQGSPGFRAVFGAAAIADDDISHP